MSLAPLLGFGLESDSLPKILKTAPPQRAEAKPLGEALEFMQVLWAIAHGLESGSKRMLAELGVTGPQRLVVRLIGHHERISAGELAEALHIHPSSLTGMLRRLEEAQLIRRESDPFDRRRALLELTRLGQRLNAQRAGTIEAVVSNALGRLSVSQVQTAKGVLRELAQALGGASLEQEPRSSSRSSPAKAPTQPSARRRERKNV